jgi:hypothetical protein
VTLLVSGSLSALWLGVTAAVDLIPVVAANDAGKLSAYSDQTLLTLDLVDRLGETFGDVSTVPRGLFLVSAGLLIVRHRMLPRWTGYLALVIGAASLIGIVVVGLFGFVLWILIVGVASVVMLLAQWQRSRRGGHPRNRPRRPAPARGGEDAPRGTLGSLHVRTPDEVKRRHPRPTAREPELRQNGPVQTDPARGGPRPRPPP